jgi:hypothetical protein
MALTLDAQSVTKPRAPASPPHSLSTPVDARRHTAPPGHGHLPAGTPQTTTASTPSRHDLQASRQAHRRCSASFSSQSSASAPHGRRQHSAPITWLFAALDRRRPWRTKPGASATSRRYKRSTPPSKLSTPISSPPHQSSPRRLNFTR